MRDILPRNYEEGCNIDFFEKYTKAHVSIEKDGLAPIVQHAIDCCQAWNPEARLIGNVMAGDLEKILLDYYDRITSAKEVIVREE